MAFTRSKRSTNPSSRIKIGGAIINPGIGELGAIDDSLRDDYPGSIAFNAFNGSTDSAAATYAQLKVHATDVSNGNKESKITLHARGSNNMIEALTVDKGGINVTGSINISAVPTSDPGVAGELWRDGTDLKISTG